MRLRLPVPLLAVIVVSSVATAQGTAGRFAVGGGGVLFVGTTEEIYGLGLYVRGTGVVVHSGFNSLLTLELGLSRHLAVSQGCATIPGGGCSPIGPPATVWSARLGLHQPLAHAAKSPAVLVGIGVYSHIGRRIDPPHAALGLDLGLGVPLSAKLALDARFVWLHSSAMGAWTTPVGVSLWL